MANRGIAGCSLLRESDERRCPGSEGDCACRHGRLRGRATLCPGSGVPTGNKNSVEVRISGDAPKGPFAAAGRADSESDPGVSNLCRDRDGKHRFKLPLLSSMFVKGRERKVFAAAMPMRAAPRSLAGTDQRPATHPWVFTTASELEELAGGINMPGSCSAKRFSQLAGQITRDLAGRTEWAAVSTGCNAAVIQYAFSYEPQDGQAEAVRTAPKLGPNAVAPAGGAVVASRLALYAALVKAGAKMPAGDLPPTRRQRSQGAFFSPSGDRGFRDAQGRFLTSESQLCDANARHAGLGSGSVI